MNAVEELIRTIPRRQGPRPPSTGRIESLVDRLTRCQTEAELTDLLDQTVASESTLLATVQAIRAAISDLSSPMSVAGRHVDVIGRVLATFDSLLDALHRARQQGEHAILLGVASPYHDTLALRPSVPRSQGLPPAELMALVTSHAREPLAMLCLAYLALARPQLPLWIFEELTRTIGRGYEAHLRHLESLGYGPATSEERTGLLDLEALYTQAQPVGEFTLDQLAARLDLPISHLQNAIDQGQLEAHPVGSRYQIAQADLSAFQDADRQRRLRLVEELTAEAQALGFYEL